MLVFFSGRILNSRSYVYYALALAVSFKICFTNRVKNATGFAFVLCI